jgi:hypothetical protein
VLKKHGLAGAAWCSQEQPVVGIAEHGLPLQLDRQFFGERWPSEVRIIRNYLDSDNLLKCG